MLPKLPLGIQSFRELRQEGYWYVDKTELICTIPEQGKYYFLSRPRRFGKSLLISTLKELFLGNKNLFKGLWAETHWDWKRVRPVVHFSFNKIGSLELGLTRAIVQMLDGTAKEHGVALEKEGMVARFEELIIKISDKSGRVVLLIDEYDKPIIDHIEDLEKAKTNREILKSFYSVLKDNDVHLELVFITGVSKFSKVSIFSDLNNLTDITLDPAFGSICGYTQAELEHDFDGHIAKLMNQLGMDRDRCLAVLQEWYNGYNFMGPEKVYNPWSILSCFRSCVINNYWFATGTPTFLIKMLKKEFYSDLDDVKVGATGFDNYDLENMGINPLLFQTGYITIKSHERGLFTLSYPNREVKDSMLQYLVGAFRHNTPENTTALVRLMEDAFVGNDLTIVISIINTAFSTIPYHIFEAESERYYHTVIHLLFTYLGLDIRSEVSSAKGRLDTIVHTDTHIYIIEFKLNQSADVALAQILDKGYAEPYRHSGKEVVLVGVNFDRKEKCVLDDGWKVVQLA